MAEWVFRLYAHEEEPNRWYAYWEEAPSPIGKIIGGRNGPATREHVALAKGLRSLADHLDFRNDGKMPA